MAASQWCWRGPASALCRSGRAHPLSILTGICFTAMISISRSRSLPARLPRVLLGEPPGLFRRWGQAHTSG